jgi:transcriptional regulator with XRE-family HTH domain
MGRTLTEKLAQIPQPRRERIDQHAAQLISEELSLRELRRALGRTQTKMATYLRVGQDTVARYEQRSDLLLSTLRRYLEAAGGKLCLIAEFPGRPSVRLKGLGDISGHRKPAVSKRRATSTQSKRRASGRQPSPANHHGRASSTG